MSLIAPGDTLPTLDAFRINPLDDARIGRAWRRRRVVEVSTLVRDPRAQPGLLIRALLYRAMWMSRARRQDQGNTERATDHLILHPRAASNRRYQGHLLGREPFDHP